MVPFKAIKGFFDPSVQFGLQFEPADAAAEAPAANLPGRPCPLRPAGSRRRHREQGRAGQAERGRRSRAAGPLPQEIIRAQEILRLCRMKVPPPRGTGVRRLRSNALAQRTSFMARSKRHRDPIRPAPRPTASARSRFPPTSYWGAQTQRSRQNFPIGGERMPMAIVRALGLIKQAAAEINRELGLLDAAPRRRHRPRRARGDRRQARRPFPAGGLADRLRHPDQHERQRGDRQPRQRDAGRRARRARSRSTPTTTSTWASRRTTRFPTAMHVAVAHARSRGELLPALSELHARAATTRPRSSRTSSRSAAPIRRTRRR